MGPPFDITSQLASKLTRRTISRPTKPIELLTGMDQTSNMSFVFQKYSISYNVMIEIKQLRYFLAVAEELNVTKAAQKLGIEQPPLSQQIKNLEGMLGLSLFRRTGRGVVLTDAGQTLLQQTRQILSSIDHAIDETRRASLGESGTLTIGFTGSAAFNSRVTHLIRSYRTRYPNVQLKLIEGNTSQLLDYLSDEKLDVAFLRLSSQSRISVDFKLIVEEPMRLVLPTDHRLAGLLRVPLALLANEPFVMLPREASPTLFDVIFGACIATGFEPRIAQYAPQLSSVVNFVAAQFGISLVPESVSRIMVDGVVYRETDEPDLTIKLALAWRKKNLRRQSENFVSLA